MIRKTQSIVVASTALLLFQLTSRSYTQGTERAPVPTASEQKETAAVLEEVYELSAANTKAKKQELIPKLMKIADDAVKTKDFDQLYGIVQAIFPLARNTQDVSAFQTAMRMLTENFAVDAAEGGQRLDDFLSGCDSSAAFEEIADKLLPTIEQIARANRLDQAAAMLTVVEQHAKRIPNKTPATEQMLADVKKSVDERDVAFKAYNAALAKLAANSEDPQANFTAGAWLAVFEDDWAGALPKLAKGSDAKWRSAAEAELESPAQANEQAEMANLWWNIANGINGQSNIKAALQRHVLDWYTQVVAKITKPLLKTAVERRIQELKPAPAAIAANPQPKPNNPPPKADVQNKNGADGQLPIGEMIDLLSMIKLPDHAVDGNWRMIDGALVCGASRDSRVMAPIVLLRNYEVRLDFTRTAGAEAIAVVCPIVGRTCVVAVGGWTGKYGGLQRIDGKALPEINDKQAVISPAKLDNGRLYTLQVNVQESRGTVTINAALNGQPFVKWRGTAERLSAAEHFMLPSLRAVGVFAFDSTVTIHSFGVQLTRGGEGYRLGDDWKNPLDVIADAPHKKLLTDCITRNGRSYLIAPKPTTHSEAQRLAASVQGRLVTISSVEENAFLFQAAKGRQLWTSAWRSGSTNDWRDERNRPLRTFWWAAREPNNAFGRQFRIMTAGTEPTFWDKSAWDPAYACIEWGEE